MSATAQLTVLGDQLQAVAPLEPGLVTLIAQLESLSHSHPAVSAILVQLQQFNDSMPTVASLLARVALLNRLLAQLHRTDPLAARGLARSLPALRIELISLLAAVPVQGGPGRQLAGAAYAAPAVAGAVAEPMLVAGYTSSSPFGQSVETPTSPALVIHRRSPGARPGSGTSSTPSGNFAPLTTAPPASEPAVGSSGGIGSNAPVVVLLSILTVWLLCFLSAPMSSDLVSWRTTLLGSRLERPG